MNNVEKKTITIWNIETLTQVLFSFIAATVIFYFFREYEFVTKSYYLVLAAGALYFIWDVILNPLYYKNQKYKLDLDDNILYVRKGGLYITDSTIPLKRIQHVDIGQSFYSRIFKLYSINIYTAGDSYTIEYVKEDIAKQLKDSIIKYLMDTDVEIND